MSDGGLQGDVLSRDELDALLATLADERDAKDEEARSGVLSRREAAQPGEPASQRQQETGDAGSGGSQDGPADGTAPSMHAEDGADGHQSLADGTDGVAASNAGPSRGETGAGDGEVRIPLQLSCLHSCGSLTCL